MAEPTNFLKVGSADLVLRMLESGMVMRDLSLDNPIRAIREISHDISGTARVRLANGRELSALEIQSEYLDRVQTFVDRRDLSGDPTVVRILSLWRKTLKAVESGDHSMIDREIDWAIKKSLIDRYMSKHDLSLSSPRISQIDMAYHDINRSRGLYYLLERNGLVDRLLGDIEVFEAKSVPPQTTRAKLRGDFVRRAQERRRDFTVDWVHLKLNDQAQRTVLCKDPFVSTDDRVDRLIAGM
jgi:proteasome accessory factor A